MPDCILQGSDPCESLTKAEEILFKQDLCTEHWTTMVPGLTLYFEQTNGTFYE